MLGRALQTSQRAGLAYRPDPQLSFQLRDRYTRERLDPYNAFSEKYFETFRREVGVNASAQYPYSSRRSFSTSHRTMNPSRGNQPVKSRDNFTYKLAAAYSGKRDRFDPTAHYHSYDSSTAKYWLAGKPTTMAYLSSARPPSGQDACFISEVKGTGNAAFGVADGVGGWADQGIDSADFSHGLCTYMALASSEFESPEESQWSGNSPQQLLSKAHSDVCYDKSINGGGSTACVAVANTAGRLEVSNLGDSGFMQLRLNKVHFYSDPQTHAFNTPYQLSQVQPKLLAQIAMFGGNSPFADTPADASVTTHDLKHGDVLVFATDGVWDNLSPQDVLKMVSRKMIEKGAWIDKGHGTQVSDKFAALTEEDRSQTGKPIHSLVAISLLEAAKHASQDLRRDGPFAKAVQKEYPSEGYRGGKIDDICLVVVMVVENGHAVVAEKSKL